jgi:hypothetical protein
MEAEPTTPGHEEVRRCPNCAAPAPGAFCAACGQAQRPLRVPFRRLVAEALDESLSLDSKLARTLPALFLRPGDATRAWREGRRASFTSPTKLYLVASFLFFFALALGPDFGLRVGISGANIGPAQEGASPVKADPAKLAALRAEGGLRAAFADHLERLQALPPSEAQRQVNAALVENAAKAMFVLVPLMGLVLLLLHVRRRITYAEHLTFALHAQTVTFALLLPGIAMGSGGATAAGLVVSGVHLLVAMRRVYGTSWVGTALRWAMLSLVYLLALAFAVAGAAGAAVLTS